MPTPLPAPRRRPARLRHWAASALSGDALVWPLYLNTFGTGLLDATSVGAFGVFSSNQTGNAVLLLSKAIGVRQAYAPQTGPALLTTGVSLAAFLLAAFAAGRVGLWRGHRARWWLLVSLALQTAVLLVCAVLVAERVLPVGAYEPPERVDPALDAIPVALLAATAGLQVSQARCSGVQEVPTAMLTSPMVDLVVHPRLFAPLGASKDQDDPQGVHSRNVRLIYVSLFLAGIAVGAALHIRSGIATVTFVAFALRIVTAALVCLLPAES